MPVGWYVVQPPTDGTFATLAKTPKAAMSGQQPEFGPMAAELKPYKMQMNGWIPTSGPVSAQIKKLTANFSKEYNTGHSAVAVKKPSFASVGMMPFMGQMSVQSPKLLAAAIGSQKQQGTIAAPMKPLEKANMIGLQTQAGSYSAALQKARASLAGNQAQVGSATVSTKAVSASFGGEVAAPPKASIAYPEFLVVPSPMDLIGLSGITTGDNFGVGIYNTNELQNFNGRSTTYRFTAVFPERCNSDLVYVEGTKGTGNNDRQSGIGIFNEDVTDGIYIQARASGKGAGQLITMIDGVLANRIDTTGLSWQSGQKLKLVPTLDVNNIVTWNIYKDSGSGYGPTPYHTWVDINNELGLPGRRVGAIFHHAYSSGHYRSPGVAAMWFGDV